MEHTPTIVAYVAGIIDGEGCIGLERVKARKTNVGNIAVKIAVTMTDRRVPDLLKALYGGSNIFVTRRNPKHKPVHMWTVYSKKAETMLREIRPFLIVKAAQADLALSVRDHLKTAGALSRGPWHDPTSQRHIDTVAFRESAKLRMHELNKRGCTNA